MPDLDEFDDFPLLVEVEPEPVSLTWECEGASIDVRLPVSLVESAGLRFSSLGSAAEWSVGPVNY